MSHKIVLIGANGMLGSDLLQLLSDTKLDVTTLNYPAFDFARPTEVRQVLEAEDFSVLINCAAYTQVDLAEVKHEEAFLVNAEGPKLLADICKKKNALLVHFSTDYVFDGTKKESYFEDDLTNPLGVYGKSKLGGEQVIQGSGCRYLILRTSWLYGQNGPNFVKKMLDLAQTRSELKVVDDQQGSPTFTKDLAAKTLELIQHKASGLLHVTNQGSCTWAGFAREIFAQKALNIKVDACTSEEYPTPAKRPKNSCLSGEKLRKLGVPLLRDWKEALKEYLSL